MRRQDRNRCNEPVGVARWTYPQTPDEEIRYLTAKRIRLVGERQEASDENNWLRVDKLDIDIKAIDESVRSLRAIRGAV